MFYAIQYPAGLSVSSNGSRYGKYVAFQSKSARDEWLGEGGDFQTSPDYREAINASDPELRSLLRQAARLMAAGHGYEDSFYEVNIELA